MRRLVARTLVGLLSVSGLACGQSAAATPTPFPTSTPPPLPTATPTPSPTQVPTTKAGDGSINVGGVDVLLPDGAPHATANVRVGDLLGDGSEQVFVAEPTRGQVVWLRGPNDIITLSEGLVQPVRTHVVDIDADGDRDILVSDIGTLWESDAKVGRVVLLRNSGAFEFERVVVLEGVGRVACAEGGDLDRDGDMDIAVCVFGHGSGKIMWLEQNPGFVFEEHVLDARPGSIHAFPFDADGDGDLDLAVSLSQDYEEVLLFRNGGIGEFHKEVLFKSDKSYFAMTGIELSDLDRDGDTDILFTNGDALNFYEVPEGVDPNDLHGLAWLENDGAGRFTFRDLIRIWGAYSVRAVDLDGDLDLDLVLATMQVPELFPGAAVQGMVWLENDGDQSFTRHNLSTGLPPLTVTIEVSDVDADGVPDILGGTMDQAGDDAGHRLFGFNVPTDR